MKEVKEFLGVQKSYHKINGLPNTQLQLLSLRFWPEPKPISSYVQNSQGKNSALKNKALKIVKFNCRFEHNFRLTIHCLREIGLKRLTE